MGPLGRIANRRWLKEGSDAPVPERGAKRYFFLLGTHFWKLVSANLLFLAFSIPLVTLPAALCALNRVCMKLVRDGNCLLWQEFWGEFRGSFASGLLLGLPFGVCFAASYYLLSLGLTNGSTIYGLLFYALGLFLLIVSSLYGSWAFVFKSVLALPNRDLIRNTRALAALEIRRDLAILGTLLVSGLIEVLLFPLSLVLIIPLLPALTQFTLCFLINPPMQARIIAPYEAAQAQDRQPPSV